MDSPEHCLLLTVIIDATTLVEDSIPSHQLAVLKKKTVKKQKINPKMAGSG
jgi:hypothetical protein